MPLVHTTRFFRDAAPFAFVRRRILPEIAAARRAPAVITMVSAGCSTGQEAYSLAMLALEHGLFFFRVAGLDVEPMVIERAAAGAYAAPELNDGLPATYLPKYFEPLTDHTWRIRAPIRERVRFERADLTVEWPVQRADVIFLRNVISHADDAGKRTILAHALRATAIGGYLVLADVEARFGTPPGLTRVIAPGAAVYQRRT